MNTLDQNQAEDYQKLIMKKSDALFAEADDLVSIFYSEKREYNEQALKNSDNSRSSHLGCRVTRNANSPGISIDWFRSDFYGPSGKRRAISTSIPKGSMNTYVESKVFDWRTLGWEKELFRQLEPQLAIIRGESLWLGKLSRTVSFYKKALVRLDKKKGVFL